MSEPAAEQPEAIDESIPAPQPAGSANPRPASPAPAEAAPSPPSPPPPASPAAAPASPTAPASPAPAGPSPPSTSPPAPSSPTPVAQSSPPSPIVAVSSGPEPSASVTIAKPEPSSPNLPAVPASPNPPPPPAPSRAPSASPAGTSPSSVSYAEAPPVPANAATPLPPPVSQPESLRVADPIPENEGRRRAQATVEIVPNKSNEMPVVVVEPKRNEAEIVRQVERASTVPKNVAFQPEVVRVERPERVPTKVVIEDNSVRVESTGRTYQDIPPEVPPVVVASAEPSRYVDPEIKLTRMRFRDRLRQGLHPGYWRSLFRRHNREKPETYLRPRKRDRLRAKLLTHAALAILIGRKPTTVVRPIVEEAAMAPRGRDCRGEGRFETLKRLLFLKRHDYARKRHAEKAELHAVYRENAQRDNFTEAEWRHAERQARHQRKAIYHAEKQARGRRRYTDEEVALAAAEYPAAAQRRNERVGYAARHLREARRNLEANIDRGQRQMMRYERRTRHPVRRLEKDVENLERQEDQVKEEIDDLTRIAGEHRGQPSEAHDQERVQAALDREEKVKRNLAVARERLRSAKDHVERDDVHRMMDARSGNRDSDEVVVTKPGKLPEPHQVSRPPAGMALDGSSQSSAKRAEKSFNAAKWPSHLDYQNPVLSASASGFQRDQKLSGSLARGRTGSRSSSRSMSSVADSTNSSEFARDKSPSFRTDSFDSMRNGENRGFARQSQKNAQLAPSAASATATGSSQKRVKTSASLTYPPPPGLEQQPSWRALFTQRGPQGQVYYYECPMCGNRFRRPMVARYADTKRNDGYNPSTRLGRPESRESISGNVGQIRQRPSIVMADPNPPAPSVSHFGTL